jgi:hypothetical protein
LRSLSSFVIQLPIAAFISVSQKSAQLLRVHIMNTIDTVLARAFDAEWIESGTSYTPHANHCGIRCLEKKAKK